MMLDILCEVEKLDTNPKKTKRILVYPNITYSKNYEQDSFVQVLMTMISGLNEIRDDLYWYVILPCYVKNLDFENVKQFHIPIPSHPPTMRVHFDTDAMKPLLNAKWDYDLIFSHLPEHTLNVSNLIFNKSHHKPKIFGYSHWFDFENIVTWEKHVFLYNISGLLEMEFCYLNTDAQKKLVLEESKKYFNDDVITKLDNILRVHNPGIKSEDVVDSHKLNTDKVIVFNHRPWAYKNYDHFISLMKKLREQRQDFTVWVPLLDKSNIDWITCEKYDKQEYYNRLSECRIGFSPKQTYAGWSVSTTDGMMNGLPFIMYDSDYYHELCPVSDFFESDEEALKLLNHYLDDESCRNEMARQQLEYARTDLIYKDTLLRMSDDIDILMGDAKRVKSQDALGKIKNIIETEGTITKAELIKKLNWGVNIAWNKYRNALLDDDKIYDIISDTPTYNYKSE